jgi:hypothetical protein
MNLFSHVHNRKRTMLLLPSLLEIEAKVSFETQNLKAFLKKN